MKVWQSPQKCPNRPLAAPQQSVHIPRFGGSVNPSNPVRDCRRPARAARKASSCGLNSWKRFGFLTLRSTGRHETELTVCSQAATAWVVWRASGTGPRARVARRPRLSAANGRPRAPMGVRIGRAPFEETAMDRAQKAETVESAERRFRRRRRGGRRPLCRTDRCGHDGASCSPSSGGRGAQGGEEPAGEAGHRRHAASRRRAPVHRPHGHRLFRGSDRGRPRSRLRTPRKRNSSSFSAALFGDQVLDKQGSEGARDTAFARRAPRQDRSASCRRRRPRSPASSQRRAAQLARVINAYATKDAA